MDEKSAEPGWLDSPTRRRLEVQFDCLTRALDSASKLTPATIEQIRRATDALLRATARIRIDLETSADQS